MSAVAALAVASPAAVVALSDLSASTKPPTQHREFVQASMITDLPNELISALSQGLSQFGINLPPMPTSLLTGSGSSTPATLTTPGLGTAPLTTPGLGGVTPATTPGLGIPSLPTTLPDAALNSTANTNPALTSPVGIPPLGTVPAAPGGLTTPPAGVDPALTSPISSASALPAPNEVPISAPIGLDPAAGTYPILGDPSLGAAPAASTGSGGLLGDLSTAANQLGAGQAIDLLKGVLMPAIMSAIKPAGAPAANAAAAAAPAAAPPRQLPRPSRQSPRPSRQPRPNNRAGSHPDSGRLGPAAKRHRRYACRLCGAVAGRPARHLVGATTVSKHWQQLTHT